MKKIYILLAVLFFANAVSAQTTPALKKKKKEPNKYFYFGLGLQAGIPQREFQKYQDRWGWGLNTQFSYQPSKKIPIAFGLDFGYMTFGQTSQTETLTATISANGTPIDTLSFPLKVTTANNFINTNLLIRFMAPTQVVVPYLDALFGFNSAWTNTSIYDESEEHYFTKEENHLIKSKTQSSDFTWSYGGAVGIMFDVSKVTRINLRAAYLFGGEAQYFTTKQTNNWEVTFSGNPADYKPENVEEGSLDINAVPYKSTTDLLQATIGVIFRFGIK